MEYEARVEIRCGGEQLAEYCAWVDAAFEALSERTELVDPIMVVDPRSGTVSLSYDCEATDARSAVELGLGALCEAVEIELREAQVASVAAHPLADADLNELVSQAEVARRLDVSREWVRKLARRPDFPKPVQPRAARAGLWRWGDVVAWNEGRHAAGPAGHMARVSADRA